MKFHPKISIIIPVYNGANYLEAAVNSALAQTYDNFEILIVNDGSNDGGKTAALAKRLHEENSKVVRYFEKTNGGVASALNLGIGQMTGDYFSWLSHDDLYRSDKLQRQVEVLSQLNEDVRSSTILYSDFDVINALGKKTGSVRFLERHPQEKLNQNLYPLVNGLIHGCSLLIPIDVLRKYSGFDEGLKHTQDYDLWLKILPACKIHHLSEPLILSRAHGEQDSMKISENRRREKEVTDLWINIFQSVTKENQIRLDGSEGNFFRKMLALARSDRVPGAHSYIIERWQSRQVARLSKPNHVVSVIIPLYDDSSDIDVSLQSVLDQSSENNEVLVVEISGKAGSNLVDQWQEKNLRVRIVNAAGDLTKGLRMACEVSIGSRIAFLTSGSQFDSDKLTRQNEYMDSGHYPFASTSYVELDSTGARKVFISNGELVGESPREMFRNQSALFCTVLIEKKILVPFLDKCVSSPGLLLWRIAKRYPLRNLDLPLSYLGKQPEAFEVRLTEFEASERVDWILFNVKKYVRLFLKSGYAYLKVGVFQRMPFRIQIQIRRLFLRI